MSEADWKPPETRHWYRIGGVIIFCVRTTVTYHGTSIDVDMEGIRPQDYAAYLTQHYVGDINAGRTIADIHHIPYPEPIRISYVAATTQIEELSAKQVMAMLSE